jgi:large subunit ribosomal protein L17e
MFISFILCTTTESGLILSQINPYMSSPCHIELILTEGEEVVPKATDLGAGRLSSRQRGARVRQAITAA